MGSTSIDIKLKRNWTIILFWLYHAPSSCIIWKHHVLCSHHDCFNFKKNISVFVQSMYFCTIDFSYWRYKIYFLTLWVMGRGLIAPAIWNMSSSSVSFEFCDPKTSTITKVHPWVCHKSKPPNRLISLSFILLHV